MDDVAHDGAKARLAGVARHKEAAPASSRIYLREPKRVRRILREIIGNLARQHRQVLPCPGDLGVA